MSSQYVQRMVLGAALAASAAAFAAPVSEDPFTLGRGVLQIESGGVEFARALEDGLVRRDWATGTVTLRAGTRDDLELQLVFEPWRRIEWRDPVTGELSGVFSGHSDLQLRAKWNLRGNDGELTAIGLLPWISLPTGDDGLGVERLAGGLILPVAAIVADGWVIGAMTSLSVVPAGDGESRALTHVHVVNAGYDFGNAFSGFAELTSTNSGGSSALGLGTALNWAPDENSGFNVGVNVGLGGAHSARAVYAGLLRRY